MQISGSTSLQKRLVLKPLDIQVVCYHMVREELGLSANHLQSVLT